MVTRMTRTRLGPTSRRFGERPRVELGGVRCAHRRAGWRGSLGAASTPPELVADGAIEHGLEACREGLHERVVGLRNLVQNPDHDGRYLGVTWHCLHS